MDIVDNFRLLSYPILSSLRIKFLHKLKPVQDKTAFRMEGCFISDCLFLSGFPLERERLSPRSHPFHSKAQRPFGFSTFLQYV